MWKLKGYVDELREFRVSEIAPEKLQKVVEAAEKSGSLTVLLGEAGIGGPTMAREAARELVRKLDPTYEVLTLQSSDQDGSSPETVFRKKFPELLSKQTSVVAEGHLFTPTVKRIMTQLVAELLRRKIIIVAINVDSYIPFDLEILERLGHQSSIRIIATAENILGPARQIMHHPKASHLSLGSLTIEESERYLCLLLGVKRIEPDTLEFWYKATQGSPYWLAVMVLDNDQTGKIKRSRQVAWVDELSDSLSGQLAEVLRNEFSVEQKQMINIIAIAEPINEATLIEQLQNDVLETLFQSKVITTKRLPNGQNAVVLFHRLFASSIRASLDPLSHRETNKFVFEALEKNSDNGQLLWNAQRLTRLVRFGLASGKVLPLPWLIAALKYLEEDADLSFRIEVALAVASHPDVDGETAGNAAKNALVSAGLQGMPEMVRWTENIIREIIANPDSRISERLRAELQAQLLITNFWHGAKLETVVDQLDELIAVTNRFTDEIEYPGFVESIRLKILAYSGEHVTVWNDIPRNHAGKIAYDTLRPDVSSIITLLQVQRGLCDDAIQGAEWLYRVGRLQMPRGHYGGFQLLSWAVATWATGNLDRAEKLIEQFKAERAEELLPGLNRSGNLELCLALLRLRQGRWLETVQITEQLLVKLKYSDPFGMSPLVQATLAMALAIRGERDKAMRALYAVDAQERGATQPLSGYRDLLVLRAHQWLGSADIIQKTEHLIANARSQGFCLIELHAWHIYTYERGTLNKKEFTRVEQIHKKMQRSPISDALLAHIQRITSMIEKEPAHSDDPEVRTLAAMGTWLPVSHLEKLATREREIVLLAALGHSSKYIADRLYISARTVDTHIANAFVKLGLKTREDLRIWATHQRLQKRA